MQNTKILSFNEIGDLLSRVKASGDGYCTNFYLSPLKLQNLIKHGELYYISIKNTVFFLKKDRGFTRLSFCSPNLDSLMRGVASLSIIKEEPIVLDLVGTEAGLLPLLDLFESQGFFSYQKLFRMMRSAFPVGLVKVIEDKNITKATDDDCQEILDFLLQSFDVRVEQIPMLYEIQEAAALGQIMIVRNGSGLSGMLFFETQGMTSVLRYWLVAAEFRNQRIGAALINRWFLNHPKVRRFLLWVVADNSNAIVRYVHYGFTPNGLFDIVLTNDRITV